MKGRWYVTAQTAIETGMWVKYVEAGRSAVTVSKTEHRDHISIMHIMMMDRRIPGAQKGSRLDIENSPISNQIAGKEKVSIFVVRERS